MRAALAVLAALADVQRVQEVVAGMKRVFQTDDLARGEVTVVATGITTGDILKGVRFARDYAVTESLVLRTATNTIRRIETLHLEVGNGR